MRTCNGTSDEISLTLETAGLSQLEKDAGLVRVEEAVRNLATLIEDADSIRRTIVREAAIRKLEEIGISASARLIDAAIPKPHRVDDDIAGKALLLREIPRRIEPVDGAALLVDLCRALRRYIVADNADMVAIALWCVGAHAIDAFPVSAFLNATSPEKGCGKSTLLTVLSFLLPRPVFSGNMTPSVIFRAIEKYKPSFLIDEADTFKNLNEELRGLLNASHMRASAQVIRNVAVADDHEPRAFSTWCPKAIALIGRLPDTLDDRSIVIYMRRRKRSEACERFSAIDPHPEIDELASRIASWAYDHFDTLRRSRPPADGIDLRLYDNWMPLLAVADAAGNEWPRWARIAASHFVKKATDSNSIKVELLTDVAEVMGDEDRMPSEQIVDALNAMPDRPWPVFGKRAKPITQAQLARMLKAFEIKSQVIRIGDKTPRGYYRDDVVACRNRYSPPEMAQQAQHENLASEIRELEAIFVAHHNATKEESTSRKVQQSDPWDWLEGV